MMVQNNAGLHTQILRINRLMGSQILSTTRFIMYLWTRMVAV